MSRYRALLALQTVGWRTDATWAVGLSSLVLGINIGVWAAMDSTERATSMTLGVFAVHALVLIRAAGTMTEVLPFAVGLSVSRRDFYGSALVHAGIQALVLALVLTVLARIEELCAGWGVDLTFFGVTVGPGTSPAARVAMFAVPLLTVSAIGFAYGAVSQRWGLRGRLGVLTGSIVLGGVAALVLAWRDGAGGSILSWLEQQSAVSLWAGWPIPLLTAAVACGLLVVRRTSA